MTSYIRYNIDLPDEQKQKLSRTYKDKCPIKLSHSQLTGNIPIDLTQTQINSIQKAKRKGVGLVLELSRKQMQYSGFLTHDVIAPINNNLIDSSMIPPSYEEAIRHQPPTYEESVSGNMSNTSLPSNTYRLIGGNLFRVISLPR